MKRRVFAMLMALVMLCSAVPVQAYAWWGGGGGNWGDGGGSRGTDLGWEYADITATTDQNGNFSGYDLNDVSGSNHLGQYVTVTYSGDTSGTKWVEGRNGRKDDIIANDSTKTVTVSCAEGYYIDWIVLACGDTGSTDRPFNCRTVATDDGMGWQHTTSSFTSVTLTMQDIYEHSNHASNHNAYYLMIEIRPVPSTIHVGYFSGTAGSHNITAEPVAESGNLADGGVPVSNTDYETWYYTNSSGNVADHTVLDISDAAEKEANSKGYSFAGWKLEYYRTYTTSSNTFSDSTSIGRDNVLAGETAEMTVNAKFTAIWQPLQTVTVSKVWSDNDNQDGMRPDNVEIHLLKNGVHTGDKLTLSAANNWAGEWKVPAKDENGLDIAWSVSEEAPAGYTAVVTGNEESGFVVTNSHSPETRVINVQKVWDDDNDRDGERPVDGVYVRLYRVDGQSLTAIGNAVELTRANVWTHQWTDLTKYEAGKEIEYTVREVDAAGNPVSGTLSSGYTHDPAADIVWDVDDQGNIRTNLLEVVNHYTPETIDISVEKLWDDGDNQDGKRPDSVEVTLKADGDDYLVNGVPYTITLKEGSNGKWTGTFEDVYKYHNAGTEIIYSVEETSALPEGYAVSISGNAANGFRITNKYTPTTTSITVTKVWDDGNNQDGLRPDSVVVTLYADGVAVETESIGYTDNWQHTFTDLPINADGQAITYTVAEIAAGEYLASDNKLVDGNGKEVYTIAVDGYTITNTHKVATADFSVTKVWKDANNQDGKRPYAVLVAQCINGQPILTNPADEHSYKYLLVLSEENNLTGTWEDLPLNSNGQRISYSVEEVGYIMEKGGTIVWNAPEGYSVNHIYDYDAHMAYVTNVYVPEKTSLNVVKSWADDSNRAGLRPSEISITLQKKVDGGEWTDVKTVAMGTDHWYYDFIDLPKYEGGKELQYQVIEKDACVAADGTTGTTLSALGYEAPVYTTNSENGGVIITNTRNAEKIDVTATKIWEDESNQDGKRPATLTFELYANGIATGVIKTVTAEKSANTQTVTFTDLYKHYGGKEIVYTVAETKADGKDITNNQILDSNGNVIYTVSGTGLTVTNSHNTEKTAVTVTKLWDDAYNQDGKRPASVTVALYANGTLEATRTITAAGGWSYTFTDLDKYADGQEIRYTVAETAAAGYTVSGNKLLDGENAEVYVISVNGYTITNTHIPETVELNVSKVWEDENNKDGVRPDSITVHLLANGTHAGENYKLILTAAGGWKGGWTKLDKYAGGKVINYTIYEEEIRDAGGNAVGYSASYSRDTNDDPVITNTRSTDTTSFTVQKVWDDSSNRDAIRPYAVYVQLYADNVAVAEADGGIVELNANNHWRYSWTGLDAHAAGAVADDITYSAKEIGYIQTEGGQYTAGMPDGYTSSGKVDTLTQVYEVINTHTPEVMDITVTKTWNDDNDRDGLRPDSIQVTLYANGQPYQVKNSEGRDVPYTITLTAGATGNWTGKFVDLPVHYNVGDDMAYSVVEEVPSGYSVQYDSVKDADGHITELLVTNTHTVAKTSITVTKVWADKEDQDGLRPESITVTLFKQPEGGQKAKIGAYDVLAENNWTLVIGDLPVNENGKKLTYTVEETAVRDYTGTYSADTLTITNTHETAKTSITVEKIWDDADNQDGKRPAVVYVHLYRNGQTHGALVPLSAENNWTYTFTDLDKYVNGGQHVTYTVLEVGYDMDGAGGEAGKGGTVPGYTVTRGNKTDATGNVVFNADGEPIRQITNTYQPETTFLNVQKIWDDDNNRAGKRPGSVTVTLYANGTEYKDDDGRAYTLTMDPVNEWDVTFFNMPKYAGGKPVEYTVVETEVGNGYKAPAYRYNETLGTIFVTNTREIEYMDVSVSKVWKDDLNGVEDNDGIRPEKVTVYLYANGILCNQVDQNGNPVLDANGDKIPVSAELSADNGWAYTFQKLHKNYQGKEILYSVKETAVAGYTTQTTPIDSDGKIVVTNTHVPATKEITVQKVWNDANDQDGVRPTGITVVLYADGKEVASQDITAADSWHYTFRELPVYKGQKDASGKPVAINYSVQEKDACVDAGGKAATLSALKYSAQYEDTSTGVRITNTREPERTALTATKIWDDNNNQDGKRPDSITLHLLANGTHMGDLYPGQDYTKVVTAADINSEGNWEVIWKDLPKYAGGKQIRYTIYEEPVLVNAPGTTNGVALLSADRYDAVYERESQDMTSPDFYKVRVINTWIPETVDLEVMKVWQDDNDRDGLRPDSIVVELYADGSKVDSQTVKASKDWEYVFAGLPKYKDGKLIEYSVREQDVLSGYNLDANGVSQRAEAKQDEHTGMFTLTNVHNPDTTGVSVRKIWEDENNNDGKRPEYIEVALKADGQVMDGSTVRLSEANRWTHVWTEVNGEPLFVRNNGTEIPYEAYEVSVPDGYTGVDGTPVEQKGQFYVTITNTRATEKMSVSVEKIWEDAQNCDGFRPESIRISLYRDGTKVDAYKDAQGNDVPGTITLNDANDWSGIWEGLYVYSAGNKIAYTVQEEAYENQDQYDAQYSRIDSNGKITVTNTHVPLTWSPEVSKIWNDSNNKAKLRPKDVTLQLYKNDAAYGEAFKLDAAGNWSKVFADLPLYENGKKIEWSVKETKVPSGYYVSYGVSYDQETMTVTNTATATPKTGDSTGIGMWMAMMVTSCAAALLLLLPNKKGKYAN